MKLKQPIICSCITVTFVTAVLLCVSPSVHAEDTAVADEADTGSTATSTQSTNEIPVSVFTIPATTADGKDPFFPNLPYEDFTLKPTKPDTTVQKPVPVELTLQGISGIGDRRLAVIGGQTFGIGEENEVDVSGGKVRVRCLEIKNSSVIVEVNGERRELRFKDSK